MACTTILVGKKASYDGSTMIARNDDSPSGKFTPKKYVVVHPDEQPRQYISVPVSYTHLIDIPVPLPSFWLLTVGKAKHPLCTIHSVFQTSTDNYLDVYKRQKYNNIDLLYEIKYWNNPVSKATLARLVNQIEKRGISYENTAHRNFRFIILIISQEDCFSETTDYLNNLISHKNLSFISIESMKEEQLFSE